MAAVEYMRDFVARADGWRIDWECPEDDTVQAMHEGSGARMYVGPTASAGHFFAYIYPSPAQEFAADGVGAAVRNAVAMALPTAAALQAASAAMEPNR